MEKPERERGVRGLFPCKDECDIVHLDAFIDAWEQAVPKRHPFSELPMIYGTSGKTGMTEKEFNHVCNPFE